MSLAKDLDTAKLDAITQEVALGDVLANAARLMAGPIRVRLVVDVNR
ncbi:hypothetical protein [Pseudoxanthomonas jiangsuensis]|nr:hypothetical protein [Pseudoxanthomonas jiangsuensis]